MRSSQRSICDTVSEAVSQAQGRASRSGGNVLLGMAGQDEAGSSRAKTTGVSTVGVPCTIKLKLSDFRERPKACHQPPVGEEFSLAGR